MDKNQTFAEKIFENYSDWILKTAYEKTRQKDICDDILQDCMVKALQNSDKLQSLNSSKLKACLKRYIVSNGNKYADKELPIQDYAACSFEAETDNRIAIDKVLYALNPRERKIIEMKYFSDKSDYDLAQILNIKESCVRMTVHRIIVKLRKEISR